MGERGTLQTSEYYILRETLYVSIHKNSNWSDDAGKGTSLQFSIMLHSQPELAQIPGYSPRLFLYSIQEKRILGYNQTVYGIKIVQAHNHQTFYQKLLRNRRNLRLLHLGMVVTKKTKGPHGRRLSW